MSALGWSLPAGCGSLPGENAPDPSDNEITVYEKETDKLAAEYFASGEAELFFDR